MTNNTDTQEKGKVYQTTKEDCQAAIDLNGCVCSQCGGILTPIETVDNSNNPTFWQGCEPCCRFDYGVKKIVFEIAKELVTKENYVHYSHMDNPDSKGKDDHYKKYWQDTQIGGASHLVRDVLRLHKQFTNANQQT